MNNPINNSPQEEDASKSIMAIGDNVTAILPMSRIMKLGQETAVRSNGLQTDPTSSKDQQLFNRLMERDSKYRKYEVVQKVATGGMGDVYYVYDQDIQRYLVLKVISEDINSNPTLIKQFIFEARVTGKLEHPNIVPMHDIGFLEDYGIYYSMTFVDGESLTDIITSGEREFKPLLRIFRKICDAVSYAHSKNIIHRDIKPDNIMVGKFGEVVLVDWGLAKQMNVDDEIPQSNRHLPPELQESGDTTQNGELKGTPFYMSPEQAEGNIQEVDQQSDIFLLGATLYHMFVGSAPYASKTTMHAILRASNGEYMPPELAYSGKEDLPRELWRIIKKAMSKNKNDRYRDLQEIIRDIDSLLDGKMAHSEKVFEKGDVLLSEGGNGDDCYVIISGKVEVFKTDDDGFGKVSLGILGPQDIVGEMALITDQPRTATAVALEKTEVAVLNRHFFSQNLSKLPMWMEMSISALANRLSDATMRLTASIVEQRDSEIERHPLCAWGPGTGQRSEESVPVA